MSAHRVVFMPSGKRGRIPGRNKPARRRARARRRSRFGLRRTRHLRALPDRSGRGRIRQARDLVERRSRDALERGRRALCLESAGPSRRDGGSAARRRFAAISSSTCRRKARFIARSCASAPKSIRSTSIRSCACTMSRSRARHARAVERFPPSATGARSSNGALPTRAPISRRSRACRRRCARAVGRPPSRCARAATSSRSGPASPSAPMASPSTSARPRSPRIFAISSAARSSPRSAR